MIEILYMVLENYIKIQSDFIRNYKEESKSVLEQSIVGHVSRFSDRYQLVGVDCKRVEFNLLRGVKGVKGVALDVFTAAATIDLFQKQMMKRFKFMEDSQVFINIYWPGYTEMCTKINLLNCWNTLILNKLQHNQKW